MSEHDAPRVVKPVRNQLSLQPTDLEALVPEEHPVRGAWALVERLDLSSFYDEIASSAHRGQRGAGHAHVAEPPELRPSTSRRLRRSGRTDESR